ncbi:Tn7-like element transposition protein TnsE [Methyloglobulus sp.]|uniref:Tn7-like element transposition protein TnsE n=1 Tax=Methyloglobulus sp. TaxID=2518622 RepID=UPI0032B75930
MSQITFTNIPKGSKLILMGDFFRTPGEDWRVTCYFLANRNKPFRKAMPVDLLPALSVGSIYPRATDVNAAHGYRGRFVIPNGYQWDQLQYHDLPKSLQRLNEYEGQLKNQNIYRISVADKVFWLPTLELARRLHFHSAELVRTAFLQANTLSLARATLESWVGRVDFTSNIPLSYMNSQEYRKYFAWLLFDQEAQNSFCSIFKHLNRESRFDNQVERWSFNFSPPAMAGCEISWVGYTGTDSEQNHYYIREILAIAALPSPPVNRVWFSHPDDVLVLNEEGVGNNKEKSGKKVVQPKQIDPVQASIASQKRYLLEINRAGLHFDTDIELKRSSRRVQIYPKDEETALDSMDVEETVGITEGKIAGTLPRADIDLLKERELIEAPEKMKFFSRMLEGLKEFNEWDYQVKLGTVPQCNCRTAHLIDGRKRQYSHVMLQRDSDTMVHILEIELKQDESLSTLLFRSNAVEDSLELILDGLMRNSIKWDRGIIAEQTTARHYLDHPDRKIKSEDDALTSWVARASQKIVTL